MRRIIQSKPKTIQRANGVYIHCKSLAEWRFATWLEEMVRVGCVSDWEYEPASAVYRFGDSRTGILDFVAHWKHPGLTMSYEIKDGDLTQKDANKLVYIKDVYDPNLVLVWMSGTWPSRGKVKQQIDKCRRHGIVVMRFRDLKTGAQDTADKHGNTFHWGRPSGRSALIS